MKNISAFRFCIWIPHPIHILLYEWTNFFFEIINLFFHIPVFSCTSTDCIQGSAHLIWSVYIIYHLCHMEANKIFLWIYSFPYFSLQLLIFTCNYYNKLSCSGWSSTLPLTMCKCSVFLLSFKFYHFSDQFISKWIPYLEIYQDFTNVVLLDGKFQKKTRD